VSRQNHSAVFLDLAMLRALLPVAALLLMSAPAATDAAVSAYTAFDTAKCKHRAGTDKEDYGTWTCPGHAGIRVVIAGGDQRSLVSFRGGKLKGDEASSQTFAAFNDVTKGSVEWRMEREGAAPFAAIMRWSVTTQADHEKATGPITPTGQVLVVTRLASDGVCHVGYVDARANKDANALARQIADEHARSFRWDRARRGHAGLSDAYRLNNRSPD
jgi:hypothetical protein